MEQEPISLETNSEKIQNDGEQERLHEYSDEATEGIKNCLTVGRFDDAKIIRDKFIGGDEPSFLAICREKIFENPYLMTEIEENCLKGQDEFMSSEETKQMTKTALIRWLNEQPLHSEIPIMLKDRFLSTENDLLRSSEIEKPALNAVVANLEYIQRADNERTLLHGVDGTIIFFREFLSHKSELIADPRIVSAIQEILKKLVYKGHVSEAERANDFFLPEKPRAMFEVVRESLEKRLVDLCFDATSIDTVKKVAENSRTNVSEISTLFVQSVSRYLSNLPESPEDKFRDYSKIQERSSNLIQRLISARQILLPDNPDIIKDGRITAAAITAFKTCLARNHLSAAILLRNNFIPEDEIVELDEVCRRGLIRRFDEGWHPRSICRYHQAITAGRDNIIKDPEVTTAVSRYFTVKQGRDNVFLDAGTKELREVQRIFIPKELDEFLKTAASEGIVSILSDDHHPWKKSYIQAIEEEFLADDPEKVQTAAKRAIVARLSRGDIHGSLQIVREILADDEESLTRDPSIREAARLGIKLYLKSGQVEEASTIRTKFLGKR